MPEMGNITVERDMSGIEGVCVITPEVREDSRGYFMETYSQRDMENAGINISFVQHNQSMSCKGVLRGLHYQIEHPQAKLVRVIHGEVFDVTVDIRPGSPTFGKYHGELLTAENKRQLLVPRGFAHGFVVLSDTAEFCYLCDDFYHPGDEGGLAWNDPAIGIAWPKLTGTYRGSACAGGYSVDGAPLILSERDQKWGGIDTVIT